MTSKHSSEVCLIDAGVTSISKLNLDPSLLSLNLHCNLLKYIDGLDALGKLKHLDLSSNSIEVISGLDNLICLKYLNLSCNSITTTEGLENLRQLVKLDLSYNTINNLLGLKSLASTGSSLSTLYIQGNNIRSIDHIINCLSEFIQLKEIVFSQNEDTNPVCKHPKYRSLLLSMLHDIQVLDGMDRSGKLVDSEYLSDNLGLTDVDDYINYLIKSSSNVSTKAEHGGSSTDVTSTPRIDEMLSKFKRQQMEAPMTSRKDDHDFQSTGSRKTALSVDHEVRLERLEHQLAHVLYKPVKDVRSSPSSEKTAKTNRKLKHTRQKSSDSDTVTTDSPVKEELKQYPKYIKRNVSLSKRGKTHQTPSTRKQTSTKKMAKDGKGKTKDSFKEVENSSTTNENEKIVKFSGNNEQMMIQGSRYVRHHEDDATFLSLIQELDMERERRWKAEQAALKLVDHVKELQIKVSDEKKLEDAALTASTKLKDVLSKERLEKIKLTKDLNVLRANHDDLVEQLKNCRETEEEQKKALRAMEAATTKLETERIQQHAHEVSKVQEQQMRATALARELELTKATNKQLKGQIQQLQELLATREQQHKVQMEGLVSIDGRDVREIINKELAKQETRFEQLTKQWEERLTQKTNDYYSLEDEFRMALQIESKRFQELQDEFTKISEECLQYKRMSQTMKDKEMKATGMVSELTALVKEQKIRITELTKSKQEALLQQKERIDSLEEETKIARKRISRIEVLEQDKSKLSSQVRAQESVIQGLRMERKLWSEELAQQGASLAQDRGRLESRLEALTAERKQLLKQIEDANDSIRIKSKMLEDQTESIRRLKLSLNERRNEHEKSLEDERVKVQEFEERLERQMCVTQELEEKNESLLQRKEELKDELSSLHTDLEKSNETNRTLKSKWQERSDLIARLEQEVKEMRSQFDTKEKNLVEERDKAIKGGNLAIEKLRSCDDAFRKQLEKQKEVYERELDRLSKEKEEIIEHSNLKVSEVEDEMRQILQEAAANKKSLEMRIKKLTNAFNEVQADLTS